MRRAKGMTGGILLLLLLSAWPAEAMTLQIPGQAPVNVPIRTLVDLRFRSVVRQSYDLSCGAAALATILRYYYADEVTEQEVVEAMLRLGDQKKIQKEGFSLLELKRFAEKRGYVSGGYRIEETAALSKLRIPAITLINVRGYSHFVVIKGVAGGEIFIADPAYGNRSRSLESFDGEWNHVILVVLHPRRPGSSAFTLDPTPKVRAIDIMRSIGQKVQSIPRGPGEF